MENLSGLLEVTQLWYRWTHLFNNKPLRMMIYLGMFTFSISILYIIYLLINILINGINIPGYFTTIAAILLLGGIQLMSIGVVRIYRSYLL